MPVAIVTGFSMGGLCAALLIIYTYFRFDSAHKTIKKTMDHQNKPNGIGVFLADSNSFLIPTKIPRASDPNK